VLDVVVAGSGLVPGDERRKRIGRVDPIEGGERKQKHAHDYGWNDEFASLPQVVPPQVRAKPIDRTTPTMKQ
jgi:hypothetical protein